MILGICNAPEVLEVMKIVKIVIQIIKIAVPIILIVYGMITYVRAIIDSDNDNLTKANKTIINMFIAAVAIFLVPTLVGTIFDIAAVSDNGVVDCFHNANKEGIINGYIERIESTFSKVDYNKAKKYIDNLDEDDPIKASYQKKISYYKEYVDIVSDIESLNSNNFSEKSKDIKNRISNITDPEVKKKIDKLYEDTIKDRKLNVSDYPISPSDSLYSDLNKLEGKSIADLLKENGSSVSELNEKIKNAVTVNGVGTREATVAAAMTLIGTLADYGYKLPYYWGGKYSSLGVDPKWGSNIGKSAESAGGHYYYYGGMDCSGFFDWAVSQGMQKGASNWWNDEPKIVLTGQTKAVCKIGDALSTDGHIALIVRIDNASKNYIIAEERNGLELSTIPFNGARYGNEQYYCESLSDKYSN